MSDLPSRFQLGDYVRAYGECGTVSGVSFVLMPADSEQVAALDGAMGITEPTQPFEFAKVCYDVRAKNGVKYRVLSDFIEPAKPDHLRLVAA